MASITVLSYLAVSVGICISIVIALKLREHIPLAGLLLLVVAPILGVALSFAAGLLHMLCENVLGFCSPTSDTTVWSVSYPLLAVPLYWAVMVFTPNTQAGRSGSGPGGTRET
jgi:hypothetical protein